MRALIQRVSKAAMLDSRDDCKKLGEIGPGLLILVGFGPQDTSDILQSMAAKIEGLRIFADTDGRMNLSGTQIHANYLLVSQFTLPTHRGPSPSSDS